MLKHVQWEQSELLLKLDPEQAFDKNSQNSLWNICKTQYLHICPVHLLGLHTFLCSRTRCVYFWNTKRLKVHLRCITNIKYQKLGQNTKRQKFAQLSSLLTHDNCAPRIPELLQTTHVNQASGYKVTSGVPSGLFASGTGVSKSSKNGFFYKAHIWGLSFL